MAGQQPISYKTVPNRNKTQKWQQAKTYNYDGDDWGGYDEYDQYGGYDEPPAPPQPPYAQSQGGRMQRTNSFDAGDETGHFSAGPQQDPYAGSSPARSIDSARRREFSNPAQVPAPLRMGGSPAPSAGFVPPPRKSSLSSGSPIPEPAPSSSKAPATDKPLPFVRPSDIYKRMAEEKEKERQSMESSRPSMDSIQREITSPMSGRKSMDSGRRPSLGPVSEVPRESEEVPPMPSAGNRMSMSSEGSGRRQFQGFAVDNPTLARALGAGVVTSPTSPPEEYPSPAGTVSQEPTRADNLSPSLPLVSRVSGFGTDFIRGDAPHTPSVVPTRAPDNTDPAADIMAERQPTRAVPGSDPAAEILAERSAPQELQHQPSQGFRSAVDKAFDRQDDDRSVPQTPISRDGSQSMGDNSGVSRSNTDSTAGISPIMSRVPSAATAQQRQTERDVNVPTIAEESSPTTPLYGSRPASGNQQVLRKPSPGHSRNASTEIAPPDRASWNTPSPNNSPARTPALEDAGSRRISAPMAAETFPSLETPDIADQGSEMPMPHLEPAETPTSEVNELGAMQQRGRSGTDYSKRESDLAEDLSASNAGNSYSPVAAEAEKENQREFLRLHTTGSQPGSPATPSSGWGPKAPPGNAYGFPGFQRSTTPGSAASPRAESPAKSRVREIATKYNDINDASRRNSAVSTASSKSSWSNFRGSQENLSQIPAPLSKKQRAGNDSNDERERSESPEQMSSTYSGYGIDEPVSESRDITPTARPEARSEQSFRPHLPGEWVSFAPTPAGEQPPTTQQRGYSEDGAEDDDVASAPPTPRGMPTAGPDETIDLTPTTRKTTLPGTEPLTPRDMPMADPDEVIDFAPSAKRDAPSSTGVGGTLSAVKGAGDALGAALTSSMGLGHQTRDFASAEPAAPIEQPGASRAPTGEFYGDSFRPPHLQRMESDAETNVTSAASSVPPTPPAKDTPKIPSEYPEDESRPISGYFSKSAKPSPLKPGAGGSRDSMGRLRPTVLPTVSTDTHASDLESDRLRKDIVRSLNPQQREQMKRESILEDQERTQDALDAPSNADRVKAGDTALPGAETRSIPTIDAPATPQKPGMLDQRFSWENNSPSAGRLIDPNTLATPRSFVEDPNAIAPELPYERPRSRQGLHIVNPNASDSDDEPEAPAAIREPAAAEQGLASNAVPIGAAAVVGAGAAGLAIRSHQKDKQDDDEEAGDQVGNLRQMDPAPVDGHSEDDVNDRTSHIPSYYGGALDSPKLQQTTSATSATSATNEDPSEPAPMPPSKDDTNDEKPTSDTAKRQSSNARIPPFREILAIKDSDQRIAAYDSTRATFATTDTGLSAWLSTMLEQNAQYANLSVPSGYKPPALQSSTLGRLGSSVPGHKHSPSIMKLSNRFGSNSAGGTEGVRRPSAGGQGGAAGTPLASSDTAGGQGLSSEQLQARGKDLMKSATVFGGKAGTSAKGWLAKGKSRFGGGGGGGRSASGEAGGKVPLASSAPTKPLVQPSPLHTTSLPPTNAATKSPTSLHLRTMTPASNTMTSTRSFNTTLNSNSFSRAGTPAATKRASAIDEVVGAPHSRTNSRPTTPAATGMPTTKESDPRSAFPFKDSTPVSTPPRPTRSSTSRTLSMTFNRLRNRSNSRSRSRPSSSGRQAPTTTAGFQPTSQADVDAMPAVLSGPSDEGPRAMAVGTEGWGAPGDDAKSPPQTPANRERMGSEDRLGVLPSPGGDTLRSGSLAEPSPKKAGGFDGEAARERTGSVVEDQDGEIFEERKLEQERLRREEQMVLRDKTDEALLKHHAEQERQRISEDDGVSRKSFTARSPKLDEGEEARWFGSGSASRKASAELSRSRAQTPVANTVPMPFGAASRASGEQARSRAATPVASAVPLPMSPSTPVQSRSGAATPVPPALPLLKDPATPQQRPMQSRTFSDRALLPSQKGQLQDSPAKGAARMDEDGNVFGRREATPHQQDGAAGLAYGARQQSAPAVGKDDAVSVVSADQESSNDAEGAEFQATKRMSSRHSSVSSMESSKSVVRLPEKKTQSAYIPSGTTTPTNARATPPVEAGALRPNVGSRTSSLQATPLRGQQNAGRPYSYHSPSPRPMSFMPLGNDSKGLPTQEQLQVGISSRTPPASLNDYTRAASTPPSQQYYPPPQEQQPAYVHAPTYETDPVQQQGNYVGSPFERVADPRQQDTEYQLPGVGPPEDFSPQRQSKRMPGLFRAGENSSGTPDPGVQMATRVAPHHRDNGQYGSDLTQIVSHEPGPQQQMSTPAKMGPGVWEGYDGSSSRTATSLSQASRQGPPAEFGNVLQAPGSSQTPDPSMQMPAALIQGSAPIASPMDVAPARDPALQAQASLKKPSRSNTTAAPPEVERKKSRLGRLGSIFGRSNTQSKPKDSPKREISAPSKPTKLQKSMPQHEKDAQVREQQRQQEMDMRQMRYQQQQQQYRPAYQQQRDRRRMSGYDAYEAARRQNIPDLRGNHVSVAEDRPQPPMMMSSPYQDQGYGDPRTATSSPVYQGAPPAGYFDGGQVPQDPRSMTTSPVYQSPPPQGWYGGPVSGNNGPAQYQQPMPEQQQQQHRRLHSAGYSRETTRSPGVPIAFQPTEASYNGYAAPIGPPSSAQRTGPYRNAPARSPSPQTPGYADQRQQSYGSQGYQQPPINPGPPPPRSYTPAQSQAIASIDNEVARSPAQQYPDQQTPWSVNMPRNVENSTRSSGASSWAMQPQGPYTGQQQQQQQQQQQPAYGTAMTSPQAVYPPSRQSYEQSRAGAGAYPTPPFSPQSQGGYAVPAGAPPQQHQGNRYYAQREDKPQVPVSRYSEGQAQPMSYQRTPSGFTGRRDERALGEDELDMRGASYPGQEWAPGR